MVGSFLRFIAILAHDVADALEETLEQHEPRGSAEGDGSELMQRFLKKPDVEQLHDEQERSGGSSASKTMKEAPSLAVQ